MLGGMISASLLLVLSPLSQAAPAAAANPAETQARPNIVLLLSDDQRADTIGAHGNPNIRTPHMDRLVERGSSFRRAYCLGARGGAVCVPSRAMIHTGRPYHGLDLGNFEGCVTLGEALGGAGYSTFATGKWHNGRDAFKRSFQTARSVLFSGMSSHVDVPVVDLGPDGFTEKRQETTHSSELFGSAAVQFLEEHESAPYFLSVAFTAPHDPRDAPQPWAHRHYADPPPLPMNFLPQHPFDNGFLVLRDEVLAPWPRPRHVVRAQLAEYYALIEHLDHQVGQILDAIENRADAENTIIVYVADHGLALGSHGLLGKQSLYEHSMRAPLILAGPGVPAGENVMALTYLSDLYATLLSAAGVEHGSDPQFSRNLIPLCTAAEKDAVRESLFLSLGKTQRAITDGRWKLIRYPNVDHTQLFDLASDPHEMVNLVKRSENAARIAALTECLEQWQSAAGDDLPLTVESPAPLRVDLTGKERKADRWQPRWIREKYFRE